MQHEAAAADARRLGLDQIEHHLRGDRRIDRTAAGAQNLEPGAGGQRIGGRDHVALGADRRLIGLGGGLPRQQRAEQPSCGARWSTESDKRHRPSYGNGMLPHSSPDFGEE